MLIMQNGLTPFSLKLLFTPMIMLPYWLALFSALFPLALKNSIFLESWSKQVASFLPCGFLLYLLWSGNLFANVDSLTGGILLSFSEYEFVLKGIVVGYLLAVIINLQKSKTFINSEILTRRYRYTFAGLVFPAAAGSVYTALGRWYISGKTIYTFGVFPALGLIMAGLVTYAILKLQLMEIDFFFSIGLIYTLLTLVLAAGIELSEEFLQGVFNLTETWSTIAITLFVAAFFAPLKDLIRGLVDRIFGKKDFDSAYEMGKLLKKMRQAPSHSVVLENLLTASQEVFGFTKGLIKLRSGLQVEYPLGTGHYPSIPSNWHPMDELDAIVEAETESSDNSESEYSIWKDSGFRLVFPINQEKEIEGALFLGPKISHLPYTPQEKDLFSQICGQIFPVFEGVSMVKKLVESEKAAQEIEWAKQMYQQIQADSGRKSFLDFPLRLYSSLAESLKGDLIDIFDQPDQPSIILCDAFHQGIQAALTLHIIHAAVKASPAVNLPKIHQILRQFTEPSLCSAVSFLQPKDSNVFRIENAGNIPPIKRSCEGNFELLTGFGKPLGLEPEPSFETCECSLKAGEYIFLSTNGLAKFFGDAKGEGLISFLKESSQLSLQEMDGKIKLSLQKLEGKEAFPDDITYILLGGRDE